MTHSCKLRAMRASLFMLTVAMTLACRSPEDPPAGDPKPARQTPDEAGSPATLMPLEVGQWTRHRVTRPDGSGNVVSYQVVAAEGANRWIEVSSGGGEGMAIQLLVQSRGPKEAADIVAARVRLPTGEMKESRGPELTARKEAFKKALGDVLVRHLEGSERRDVTVPAGTFAGTFVQERVSEASGSPVRTRTFTHPSVPISGLVLSEGVTENSRMELEAYGLTGGKSATN